MIAHEEVRRLDFQGKGLTGIDAYFQYQRRNSFGLDPKMKIYRIFQEEFYEKDVSCGCLTLPRATASVWNDPLENPLLSITVPDPVTGLPIHLGSTVGNFFALCWTRRQEPTEDDWANFSHGKPAVRIETTVEKLLERVMDRCDSAYMNRHWLIDVDYQNPTIIEQMRTPHELLQRMEFTGALLALSAAIVRTDYSVEDEVRQLFDNGTLPTWNAVAQDKSGAVPLVRFPFDWSGFVEASIRRP